MPSASRILRLRDFARSSDPQSQQLIPPWALQSVETRPPRTTRQHQQILFLPPQPEEQHALFVVPPLPVTSTVPCGCAQEPATRASQAEQGLFEGGAASGALPVQGRRLARRSLALPTLPPGMLRFTSVAISMNAFSTLIPI